MRSAEGNMPYRVLGRTGVQVSALGLGGSHIGSPKLSSAEAVRIIHAALDGGLSFMDNSWDYNEGESERRLGKALKAGYRSRAFVMTKVDGRTKREAARQLDESLKRLGLEEIDLLQHQRGDPIRRRGIGSRRGRRDVEAFVAARQAGKIRFIGFTGHKDPAVHLHMLDTARLHRFRFDTVQMPLNLLDTHYRSFEKKVLPELVAAGIGVLGMKSMGSGVILKSKAVTPIECLHYSLNLPTSVVITGIDSMNILKQAFKAAASFKPLTRQQVARLRAKSAIPASNGEFELFKTTSVFDSTAKHPEWLGEESGRTQRLAGE